MFCKTCDRPNCIQKYLNPATLEYRASLSPSRSHRRTRRFKPSVANCSESHKHATEPDRARKAEEFKRLGTERDFRSTVQPRKGSCWKQKICNICPRPRFFDRPRILAPPLWRGVVGKSLTPKYMYINSQTQDFLALARARNGLEYSIPISQGSGQLSF